MSFQFRFTIFTPCFNSEKYIYRVIESIEYQTFRNFEWLVVDDASTDNTLQILEEYASKASFSIRILHNPINRMLYYNFNIAFDSALGELMIFAGHDDRFERDTLAIFNNIWEEYGNSTTAGIWCLCKDQNGLLIGNEFPKPILISNYFKMFSKYIYKKERFGCTRTDILKQNKFNLEKNRIGEGFLWEQIGLNYDTIYLNKILRTYYIEIENETALSRRKRSQVSKEVYLSYLDWVNDYLKITPSGYVLKMRFHFAFVFYGIAAGQSFLAIIKNTTLFASKILHILLFPFAFLLIFSLKKCNRL